MYIIYTNKEDFSETFEIIIYALTLSGLVINMKTFIQSLIQVERKYVFKSRKIFGTR